ncbi:MAG: nucleoside kinase [Clostridia bacterium]|nr:nucleoside kinase [Clostridia bacterium]
MDQEAFKINRYITENRFDDLIELAESVHESQYEMLIRLITAANKANPGEPFVGAVLITGPSSSGKTTFSNQLEKRLDELGFNCTVISIDDYYRDRDEIIENQIARGDIPGEGESYDFECLEAFNVSLFREQMSAYARGEEIELPKYDFLTGKMKMSGRRIKPEGNDILLVEGIQAMNPAMCDGLGFSRAFKVYICPFNVYAADGGEDVILSNQVRFMRRAIRDYATRDSSLEYTIHLWPAVRAGEEKYIKPMKQYADFFFNSSLPYEIPFLKKRIYELRETLTDEEKELMGKYVNFEALEHFLPYSGFKIPEDSIFNEFYHDSKE